MGVYNWENFQKEEYFETLCDFFNNDIFGFSRYNQGKKWSSVVFVSRKAYCLYLLLKSKKMIRENECQVYSDRYIMKALNRKLFEEESVALIDDTITTGRHMADVYGMMKERTDAVQVIPVVFAEDRSYSANKNSKRYEFQVQSRVTWNSSEILKFCSIETLIMYQEKIPYVIELPVVKENHKNYITLTNVQFEKLKAAENGWRYLECNESGYKQNTINYGIMVMEGNSIAEYLSSFVFSFCVRLQITGDENEKQIVAIPFAVLKSVRYDELFEFFKEIYKGTSYYEAVSQYKDEYNNDKEAAKDLYIAIYRGIVFNLSEYIGTVFAHYLKKEIMENQDIVIRENHREHNFEDSFLESTKNIFEKDFGKYFFNLLRFRNFTSVKVGNSLRQYIGKFRGIQCDYRTVSLYLLAIINEIRDRQEQENSINIRSEQKNKFITIEELQMTLYDTFLSEKKEKLDNILLMCICSMLGQSKLANEIFYDAESNIVYRGFKYGENSQAESELSAKIFYVGVKTYYDTSLLKQKKDTNVTAYSKMYGMFLVTFSMFLNEYNLYGTVMTKDEFRIYSEMYRERSPEKLKKLIGDKSFLGEDSKQPIYLEKLQQYIKESDIY